MKTDSSMEGYDVYKEPETKIEEVPLDAGKFKRNPKDIL